MKKLVYYIGILVCTSVFLSSCIKEDLSDCPPNGLIPQFKLVRYDGNDSITNGKLYSASVYVFDDQDNFINSYQIPERPELDKVYTADWGLPPGNYHFSVWLNHHEKVSVDPCVRGKSTRTNTTLGLVIPNTRMIDRADNIPFLCYGKLDNQSVDTARYKLYTIPIMQLTNRIDLKVTGLRQSTLKSSTAEGDNYVFSITDNNGVYGFDGDFAPSENFTYSTSTRDNSDTLNLSLTVLKLSRQRLNPVISIKNSTTGEQVAFPENLTDNLIQLILSGNPNNDFDKKHIYKIVLDFSLRDGTEKDIPVTITIDDWIVYKYDTELGEN